MKTNKLLIPLLTGLVIVVTLYVTVVIRGETPFEMPMIISYPVMGLIGAVYSYILLRYKMKIGAYLFLLFTIISGIAFYLSMPRSVDLLIQMGAILGWFMLMGVSFVLPLVVEFGIRLYQRYAKK